VSALVRLLLVCAFAVPPIARAAAGEVHLNTRSAAIDASYFQTADVAAPRFGTHPDALKRPVPAPAILPAAPSARAAGLNLRVSAREHTRRTACRDTTRGRAPPVPA